MWEQAKLRMETIKSCQLMSWNLTKIAISETQLNFSKIKRMKRLKECWRAARSLNK